MSDNTEDLRAGSRIDNVHTDPTAIDGMEEAASHEHAAVAPDGSVVGFKAGRTLRLRVELTRQLRRRRTQLILGLLVLLPFILVIAFQINRSNSNNRSGGFIDLATASAPNFVVTALFVSCSFLLPMIVAIFFGDTIASEASWSSLKYLLAMPIPRYRVIKQKAIASGLLSFLAIVILPLVALIVGIIWYGTGQAVSPTGDAVSFSDGILAIGGATIYIAIQLLWVAGLALFLSVSTDAPLGAVGGTVVVAIVSQILDQITALDTLRNYLPTHYAFSWSDLISTDIDWSEMTRGVFSAVTYAAIFGILAIRRFTRKDITS